MTTSTQSFHIERYQNGHLLGWAYDSAQPDESLAIKIFINGEPVASVRANVERKDLKDAGMGNGKHAFKVNIRDYTAKAGEYVCSIKDEQGADLTGDTFVIRVHEETAAAGTEALDFEQRSTKAAIYLEQQKLNEKLFEAIDQADDPHKHLEIVIEHFSHSLARLQVGARTLETIAASELLNNSVPDSVSDPSSNDNILKLRESLSMDAGNFSENQNFYPLEKTKNEQPYRWTGPEARNVFSLAVDRSKERTVKLRLFNSVEPELLKELEVIVDGEVCEHKLNYDKSIIVITGMLKPVKKFDATQVELKLPRTHSPQELGSGNDMRKLGVAFHAIEVE
ncbi:hypothetical protein [Idiomarina sp.]|uniref:hypothetical protein n=1 Tax=Idiomarina sp. TaxID=1874361 RepID=UPI0025C7299F|nr:hypothetical protein [Idiomarina sp.]NQZ04536.1 hypothetical protein [Idiomarina sp.]